MLQLREKKQSGVEERKIERKRKKEEFPGRRRSSLKKIKRENRLELKSWLLGI